MAERYDAAIIGAGADGLAAAARLARAGLRVVVLERQPVPGGQLVTREFHPGFRAAPFADTVAPIPDDLFWSLDLARHGALQAPAGITALWPDRSVSLQSSAAARLLAAAHRRRDGARMRACVVPQPPPRWKFRPRAADTPWPVESWTHGILGDLTDGLDSGEAALLGAAALEGRAADPFAAGSVLHLLTAPQEGAWRGALGGLGAALAAAARDAGAEISCGVEVGDIATAKGRVGGVSFADGSALAARAVISTLDLKRTFLSHFAWSALDPAFVKQIADFRIAGATARLLVALSASPTPRAPGALPRGAIHLSPDLGRQLEAHAAWRAGIVAEHPPLTLRFVHLIDPALAPPGAAVMTVTIGAVPHTLFDGGWTREKRDLLTRRVLADIEEAFPGLGATVLAAQLLVPPDFEETLGATAGALDGGEIAPDQMFAFRPGFAARAPRTPVAGLYLGGASSAAAPFGTCVAGAVAADTLLSDLRAGALP